ncbi:transposase InsO family protein [Flavobacterium arsenatis]|uniref:Transposase InsO family protein n=2 Tax=Flavobacterium arsenatis TaxID=1484332 RepID=A0ABU1TSB4_9FLAO|nr:transposase InsO family protein [Flavobacterium arsenatis]
MTQNGDPYENAMAERVNGILKNEFKLNRLFKTQYEARIAVENSISSYNQYGPHMSYSYLTPVQAHDTDLEFVKLWKPKKLDHKKSKFNKKMNKLLRH